MKATTIKSRWIGLHPTLRMDARYWLKVTEKLKQAGRTQQTATDADVKASIRKVGY